MKICARLQRRLTFPFFYVCVNSKCQKQTGRGGIRGKEIVKGYSISPQSVLETTFCEYISLTGSTFPFFISIRFARACNILLNITVPILLFIPFVLDSLLTFARACTFFYGSNAHTSRAFI